jgi:hypothetical protein
MSSRQNVLMLVAALLAGIYICFFTDWIHRPRIQILAQTRPIRPTLSSGKTYPVSFLLDGNYRLTDVAVVPYSAIETNKYTQPLWHLVAYTNAPPTQGFLYGARISGMKPATTNVQTQPLQPNSAYRLLVEAGRARGQIDFRTSGPVEQNN